MSEDGLMIELSQGGGGPGRCATCPMTHTREGVERLPHAAGSRHRRFRQPAEVARGHTREDRVAMMSERSVIAAVHPNPGGFAALCQTLLSPLPMTIRDPAPNVGVPSVAPRRQR